MRTIEQRNRIWSVTLEHVEATVASHLGLGRVPGSEQVPCFTRQICVHAIL
jgi:hypothetical protein